MTRVRRAARRYALLAIGVVGVAALVIAVNPAAVARAVARADIRLLALMLPAVLVLYCAHGVAWWLALRGAGAPVGLRRAVRAVFVSQAFDVVPGGDLWRVPIVGADGGARAEAAPLAATVIYDDLVYFLVLSLAMLPAAVRFAGLRLPLAAALVPQLAILGLLAWPAGYARLAGSVGALRPFHRYRPQLTILGPAFRRLLRPATLVPVLAVDAVCAALSISLFWLALLAVGGGGVGLYRVAFTYSATQVVSGLTVLPGALGAYEALSTGALALQGAPPAAAAAAALVYRAVNDLLMAVLGLLVGVARRPALTAIGLRAR